MIAKWCGYTNIYIKAGLEIQSIIDSPELERGGNCGNDSLNQLEQHSKTK